MKKRMRILSILAAVVLLVTMSAVALPVSAAAPSAITNMLAKYQAYDQNLFNSVGVEAIRTAIAELSEIVENYDSMNSATAVNAARAADTNAQAGMMKNLADGAWIPYSQRATYEVYVKEGVTIKDYAIATPTDWTTLLADTNVAAGKPQNRFGGGYTFHLTSDIDMNGQPMVPLGYGDEFNGNINGHNHVFKRINLQVDSTKHVYAGLVGNMIWGGIQNLGIESGTITVTGSTAAYVGAFAGNLRGAYLRKCWNAASITVQNAAAGYFGGLIGCCNSTAPVIDGCYNLGTLSSNNAVERYGIHGYGGNQAKTYNSFAHGYSSAMGDQLTRYHTGAIGEGFVLPIANTYSTGNLLFSWNGSIAEANKAQYDAFCAAHTLTAAAYTGGELAYKLNQGYVPTGKGDGLRIYYTNGNGKVFFGTEKNQTRKIQFEGAKTDTYYLPANGTYDMDATFGVSAANSAFIITADAESTLVGGTLNLKNEDITIKIINDCEHSNGFNYTAENGVHTKTCKDRCGYVSKEPCAAESYTADAIDYLALAAGQKATHRGICATCDNAFVKECNGEYIAPADQSAEHYWHFEGCDCGREDILNIGTAAMKAGDACVDGKLNVLDGLSILKSIVNVGGGNRKNADVNADGKITIDDAIRTIRAWLGEDVSIALLSATEAKINANLFNKATAQNGYGLNMDGTIASRTNNYVSAAIEVSAGQKLTFGPVRLGQPVFGYLYDAEGEALQLMNHTNTTVVSTFEEGMVLVSYAIPEGGATVKVNVPASDAEIYALRLNSNMHADEYGIRMGVDPAELSNPLYKKGVLTVGDSICEAARDVAVGGLKGWASSIYQEFDANVTNSGVSGAALSDCRLDTGTWKHQISAQISQHAGAKDFEYILIHGGINDAWDNVSLGTVSASFDPTTFDVTTFAGGMELAIYEAVKNFGNTAAIGYHINFAAPLHSAAEDFGNYIPIAKAICAKWGIKYVDIYSMEFDTRLYTADYIHPNEEGYDVLGEPICAFMPEMRPVPLSVWEAVQETL